MLPFTPCVGVPLPRAWDGTVTAEAETITRNDPLFATETVAPPSAHYQPTAVVFNCSACMHAAPFVRTAKQCVFDHVFSARCPPHPRSGHRRHGPHPRRARCVPGPSAGRRGGGCPRRRRLAIFRSATGAGVASSWSARGPPPVWFARARGATSDSRSKYEWVWGGGAGLSVSHAGCHVNR